MNPERRRFVRKRIEKLSYIHLEPGNGAIILDASEEGLGFHAAGPIQTGPTRFYVSLEARKRVEIQSEVIWTDASRKTGGLHFADSADSGELRKLLMKLLGERISVERSVPVAAVAAVSAGDAAASPAAVSVSTAASGGTLATDGDKGSGKEAIAHAASLLPKTAQAGAAKISGSSPLPEPPRLSAAGLGFFAFSLLGLLCWMGAAVFICRHPVGHSLVQIGEWLNGGQQQGLAKTISPVQQAVLPSLAARSVPSVGAAGPTPRPEGLPQQAVSSGASLTDQQRAMRELDRDIAALEQVYANDVDPYAGRARSRDGRQAARVAATGDPEPVRAAANAPNETKLESMRLRPHFIGAPRVSAGTAFNLPQ